MADSFDALKRSARHLELAIEQKLTTFSSSAGAATDKKDEEAGIADATSGEAAKRKELDDDLRKLTETVDRMAHTVAEHPSREGTAVVQRFREVLHDFKVRLRQQQVALRQKRENAALFRDLRGDKAGGAAAVTDTLLRERSSLVGANRAIDNILAQAAETREALLRQRSTLVTSAGTIGSMLARIPGASLVMDAIATRRLRNDRIVAVVIALCLVFVLWWMMPRRSGGAAVADAAAGASIVESPAG